VAVTVQEHEHVETPGPPPRRGLKRWTAGGWLRVLWLTPLAFAFTAVLVVGLRVAFRAAQGADKWHTAGFGSLNPASGNFFSFPPVELQVLIVAWLVVVPLAFLVAIGGFDYWAYWVSGRPTRPEDHSSHGARTWTDDFRVHTDR
jgi:hypothetical protein